MKTISINFQIPASWSELSDKQLRYVYQLIADNFAADEIKTLCLLHWTGTKVIGKQNSDGYLLNKGRFLLRRLAQRILASGECRRVRDCCIFRINGLDVFL